jgi:hypothetical protein
MSVSNHEANRRLREKRKEEARRTSKNRAAGRIRERDHKSELQVCDERCHNDFHHREFEIFKRKLENHFLHHSPVWMYFSQDFDNDPMNVPIEDLLNVRGNSSYLTSTKLSLARMCLETELGDSFQEELFNNCFREELDEVRKYGEWCDWC